jgi:hypothetical protein
MGGEGEQVDVVVAGEEGGDDLIVVVVLVLGRRFEMEARFVEEVGLVDSAVHILGVCCCKASWSGWII